MFTAIHHIEHWACGGDHALTNLITVCNAHHRAVHEGGFRIAGDGNAPVFLRPDDSPMTVPPADGDATVILQANTPLALGPKTLSRGTGDPLKLDYAIGVYAELHPNTRIRSHVPAGTSPAGSPACTRPRDRAESGPIPPPSRT